MKVSFPNAGKVDPFNDALIDVANLRDEMQMLLEFSQEINNIEYQIDVAICCEELREKATTILNGLPTPGSLMEIIIVGYLENSVIIMTEDLYPPVIFVE